MTEIKIPNRNRSISGSVLELEKQKAKTTSINMKGVCLEFEEADIKKLKVKAAQEGTTMSAILRYLIKEYI